MSTRGLYTFKGEMLAGYYDRSTDKTIKPKPAPSWNVYRHSDNYPTGAAEAINAALEFAWTLPRYEADEFACAFIAANKSHWINSERKLMQEALDALGTGRIKLRLGERNKDGAHWQPDETDANAQRYVKALAELEQVRKYKVDGGGGIRMMPQGAPLKVAERNCSDIEYRYEIFCPDARVTGEPGKPADLLHVKAYSIAHLPWGDDARPAEEELIFAGSLASFTEWAKREAEKARAEAEKERAADLRRARARAKRAPKG